MRLSLLSPRYWPLWFGLTLLRTLTLLPYPVLVVMGRLLGRVLPHLPVAALKVARKNIDLCLPELPPAARARLVKRHFESAALTLFETALSWWASDARIRRITRLEGQEHLDQALTQGKGAILLSAHFTTLEIGARALAARMPLNVMYRPTNNPLLAYFLARNRGRRTKRAIARDDVRTLIKALRENGIVWYAPDQAYRKKGAEMVKLFGIPAATNTSTSRLARMTGAAVLPYFPERLPGFKGYRMHIQPALTDFPSDSPAADAERFNHLIEAHIHHVPEQYLWLHKRFKGLSDDYPDYYATAPRREST